MTIASALMVQVRAGGSTSFEASWSGVTLSVNADRRAEIEYPVARTTASALVIGRTCVLKKKFRRACRERADASDLLLKAAPDGRRETQEVAR
ncbi:hypothetical protein [Nonomuraea dietziae]|uniref:hypothetical protein n=1 Tax=Nonomuraea dietziae TaxID=65515 RepID=UPI0033C214D6